MEITLREWSKDDVDTLVDIVNHTTRKYLRCVGEGEYTKENAKKYINYVLNKGNGLFRAIEYDGKTVGSISLEINSDIASHDAHISYYIKDLYSGKGIMTMAVKAMVKEAFSKLDIVRITAYVASPNIGSIRVLENNRFKCEGLMRKASIIDNEFEDVAIYALLKENI